jgi:hypothetical protein
MISEKRTTICSNCRSGSDGGDSTGSSFSALRDLQRDNIDLKRRVVKYHKIIMNIQADLKAKNKLLDSLQ